MKNILTWSALAAVLLIIVCIAVADQASEIRRDHYLLTHKCRLVNYSGGELDQLYECDTGQIRLREI